MVPAGGAECWFSGTRAAAAPALGGAASGHSAAPAASGYGPAPPLKPAYTEPTPLQQSWSHTAGGVRNRLNHFSSEKCIRGRESIYLVHSLQPAPCDFSEYLVLFM